MTRLPSPGTQGLLDAAVDALAQGAIAALVRPASADILRAREECRALCARLFARSAGSPYHSRSATPGRVAVAACRERPIGVDVQQVLPGPPDITLLQLALHAKEWASYGALVDPGAHFYRLWTRKEAALKALGTGLAIAPNCVHVGWERGWQRIDPYGHRIHVRELECETTHALAVAAMDAAPPVRFWTPPEARRPVGP